MNKYDEMKSRHQAEVSALPLGFAFNKKQFNEMMGGWGLDPEKDADKIYSIGAGGYIQQKDAELLRQTTARHREEMKRAVEEDKTGEGFIYDMFLSVLADHEYGYTRDMSAALASLGYTVEQVVADERLGWGIWLAHLELTGE